MLTLKDWFFTESMGGGYILQGYVYGHYRLGDGDFIHTSTIKSICRTGGGEYLAVTRSGSPYHLKESEMEESRKEDTQEILSQQIGESLPEVREIETAFEEKEKRGKRVLAETRQRMENGDLYLAVDEHSMHIIKAYFKWEDKIYIIKPSVHVGMFQDSVLITDYRHGEVDFRYFPDMDMRPYHWSDGLESIYVHNMGPDDFYFRRTEERILCPAFEATRIMKKQHQDDGFAEI